MQTIFVGERVRRTLIQMDLLHIKRGSVAVCDDRIVVVCAIRRDGKVQVRDLVSARTRLVAASKLSARRLPEIEEKSNKLHHRLVKASPKQFEEAKHREACVVEALTVSEDLAGAIEKTAKRHRVTNRTLWRWVSIYRKWPSTEALVLDGRGVRSNDRRFDDSTESIIRRAIDDVYLTQPKGSYEAVCEEAWRQFDTLNIKRPSRNAIIRRIKGLDPWLVARHQLGREEADRKLGAKPGSLKVKRPLALVQIDHTRVDVHVVDDKHRKDIGRPWITVAIDVATRCILGFYLSLEAPGSASVAACLSHAFLPKDDWLEDIGADIDWPVWGLPQRLHADNAREFRSEALTRGCAEWGIELDWRPIGQPHYGGHIERLIGTLMGRVHLLPGTSQSNTQKRGRYKPDRSSRLTMGELERWIALEIAGRYHLSVHRALRKPPIRAWQEWFAERGRHPAIPGDPNRLKLSFMPIIKRTLSPQGIRFNYIQYWDDALLAISPVKGQILLRYDPRDISCLYALDDSGRYWRIPYADIRLQAITLSEAKAAAATLRADERRRSLGHEIVRIALKKRVLLDEAEKSTRGARRTQQRTSDSLASTKNTRKTRTDESNADFNTDPPEYGVEIWEYPR